MKHTGNKTAFETHADGRIFAPVSERNFEPILKVLAPLIKDNDQVLELASGTGQHIVKLAKLFPDTQFYPTDVNDQRLHSIEAWTKHSGVKNVAKPFYLDAGAHDWPEKYASINMVTITNLFHLISEKDMVATLKNIYENLSSSGTFSLYGPFVKEGKFTSDGDRDFHNHLKQTDPNIGYKDTRLLEKEVKNCGFLDITWHNMPANNLVFIAKKR